MKAARAELDRTDKWPSYYRVLTAYYGVPSLEAYKDVELTHIPKNCIACYTHTPRAQPPTGIVWSASKENGGMSELTALHEFFHHLVHAKGIKITLAVNQALADSFADAVMAVL